MKIAVTGHRPKGLNEDAKSLEKRIADTFLDKEPELVIVGMASGVDLIAGLAAIKTCFPYWAVLPWAGHERSHYIKGWEKEYSTVKHFAQKVIILDESEEYPGPGAFFARNHFMVDNATHLLAYLKPGTNRGGTFECVNYAKKKKVPVRNIYA